MADFGLGPPKGGRQDKILPQKDSALVKFRDGKWRANQKIINGICRGLRAGLSLTKSAERMRLDPETVRRWFIKGERGEEGYRSLHSQVIRSRPDAIMMANEVIAKQAQRGDWRAAKVLSEILSAVDERFSEDAHRVMSLQEKVDLILSHPEVGPAIMKGALRKAALEQGGPEPRSKSVQALFPDEAITVASETVDD